jgi:hypothetical protein
MQARRETASAGGESRRKLAGDQNRRFNQRKRSVWFLGKD